MKQGITLTQKNIDLAEETAHILSGSELPFRMAQGRSDAPPSNRAYTRLNAMAAQAAMSQLCRLPYLPPFAGDGPPYRVLGVFRTYWTKIGAGHVIVDSPAPPEDCYIAGFSGAMPCIVFRGVMPVSRLLADEDYRWPTWPERKSWKIPLADLEPLTPTLIQLAESTAMQDEGYRRYARAVALGDSETARAIVDDVFTTMRQRSGRGPYS